MCGYPLAPMQMDLANGDPAVRANLNSLIQVVIRAIRSKLDGSYVLLRSYGSDKLEI